MGKQKILLLGMSYPNVGKQMEKGGYPQDLLTHKETSINQAVECVERGIMTEMDGRDLARCIATESVCGVECYCASLQNAAVYRHDRHVRADFNKKGFCNTIHHAFGMDITFSQVILDYYWMPTGWLVTRYVCIG